ncbi:MAG: ECF transporter S component [Erysipelothrix sp.]|nr:ECF transporter S component [Erysipelothrix sp.]
MSQSKKKNFNIAILGLLTAIMLILGLTPFGTISFGAISITIAHIPILVATLMLGLKEGFMLALIFGVFSMTKAYLAPVGLLDPLFQNPLISIAPRLMIPIMTHLMAQATKSLNKTVGATLAVITGNLSNTFFVYLSMYLFVRDKFEIAAGKSAITAIIGLVSTSTFIKTIIVVIITVPIVTRIKVPKHYLN